MDEQELKQRLLAEAEKAIDKLLQQKPETNEATFSELEDWVGELGKTIEQATLSQLVEVEEEAEGGVRCPECGSTAQNKGVKKRQVVSIHGTVEIERRYYYCRQCRQGFFPPG
jgi:uncharacterized protein with PIN domain